MSNNPKAYTDSHAKTLDAFKNRASSLPYSASGYDAPTPEDVGELIKLMGWSQNDVAKMTGVNYDPKKGSPTVRRWKAPVDKPDHRDIPYSAWRLLLIAAGIAQIDDDLTAIDKRRVTQ